MKKIIALAVAAVVAAPAMADLTISGGVSAGYSTNSDMYTSDERQALLDAATHNAAMTYITDMEDAANATEEAAAEAAYAAALKDIAAAGKNEKGKGGFGVDGASIKIAGSETLENGLTISGYVNLAGIKRGATVGGEDAELKVSGDFGSFRIAEIEAGNGVFGYGTGGVTEDFTGEFSAKAGNLTSLKYVAPAMGMATIAVAASDDVGYGEGEDKTFAPDVNVALAVSESVGVWANYRPEKDSTTARTRFGASVAAAGLTVKAAIEMNDDATDTERFAIGAAYAMGATTLGVGYASEDAGSKLDGMSYGFKHALSSNVAVAGKYTTYETAGEDVTKTNLVMSLAF